MKTSNKILLIAFGVIILSIIVSLIYLKATFSSAFTDGDGNLVEVQRDIPQYEKIKINGKYLVLFSQDSNDGVVIKADENLMEFIKTEVRNNQLTISSSQMIKSSQEIEIKLSSPSISRVEVSGAAHFSVLEPLNLENLELIANAGSRMEVEGNFNYLSVQQNAGARIILRGETETLKVESNAGGMVDAYDLKAVSAKVTANAGASAGVNAAEIDASANAGASIRYIGNPVFIGMSTSAGGSISKTNR